MSLRKTIRLSDGRTLAYLEAGDPEGQPQEDRTYLDWPEDVRELADRRQRRTHVAET